MIGAYEFQPSPGAMAGCDDRGPQAVGLELKVSTLTRRDGRVRPVIIAVSVRFTVFQPSPGAMAGCDSCEGFALRDAHPCFNPHPARWPGATGDGGALGLFG